MTAPARGAAPRAYVTDLSDIVTVVDTGTNTVIGALNPPISAGFFGVAVSPDGSTVYLADGNHSSVRPLEGGAPSPPGRGGGVKSV